jgi:glycerophosphoryl diester phosphodiesterase
MAQHSTITRAMLASVATGWTLLAPAAVALDLQGHRGARGLAPENTLEGFAEALAQGVTTLEMDLGVTKDGVVVVAHDSRLNRDLTRGPDGAWLQSPGPALIQLSLAELQQFDVGRVRPDSRYAETLPDQRAADGARVPTLAEVVALTRRAGNEQVRFNLETKLSPLAPDLTLPPAAFAEAVVAVVQAEGIAARTTIQSFDWRSLRAVKTLAPAIETACLTMEAQAPSIDYATPPEKRDTWEGNVQRGRAGPSLWTGWLDVDDFGGDVPALVKAAGCAVWSPEFDDLTADAVRRAHELGLEVVAWTVNRPDDMAALIEMGVDGIITDYPDRLRAVMTKQDLPLPAPTPVEARDLLE